MPAYGVAITTATSYRLPNPEGACSQAWVHLPAYWEARLGDQLEDGEVDNYCLAGLNQFIFVAMLRIDSKLQRITIYLSCLSKFQ